MINTLGCDDHLGLQLWSGHAETPDSEGMLQICTTDGQWKAVCKKYFGCQDAKVACRHIGYEGSNG